MEESIHKRVHLLKIQKQKRLNYGGGSQDCGYLPEGDNCVGASVGASRGQTALLDLSSGCMSELTLC